MRIRFLKDYRGYAKGRDYDVPEGAALIYLKRKIAVRASPERKGKKPPK